MSTGLAVTLALIALLALLVGGRSQIATGANAQVANGAVLLTLAILVGLLLFGVLA